jgi:hypothetical protein
LRSGSVPASLRLRSTFPFAIPQAEAFQKIFFNLNSHFNSVQAYDN